MDYWAGAPDSRGQMVLFATKLDEVIAAGHPVLMLEGIRGRRDHSAWEAGYDLSWGQPQIPPFSRAANVSLSSPLRVRIAS